MSRRAKAQLKIRMSEQLRQAIERAARLADVSMNAEMVHRLEQSFRDDRVEAILIEIRERLSE